VATACLGDQRRDLLLGRHARPRHPAGRTRAGEKTVQVMPAIVPHPP
jgi:hypothetical protein